jgi:hypothetical protein
VFFLRKTLCGLLETRRIIVNQLTDIYALATWLSHYGIDFKAWGENSSKSLNHLWQELQAGRGPAKGESTAASGGSCANHHPAGGNGVGGSGTGVF